MRQAAGTGPPGANMGDVRSHETWGEGKVPDLSAGVPVEIRSGDVLPPVGSASGNAGADPTPYQAIPPAPPQEFAHIGGKLSGNAWRRLLFGTVAAGTMLLYGGRRAEAQCYTGPANVATCTGYLAAGVSYFGAIVDTVNVNSLYEDIAPGVHVSGISLIFTGGGTASVTSNHGAHIRSRQAASALASRCKALAV